MKDNSLTSLAFSFLLAIRADQCDPGGFWWYCFTIMAIVLAVRSFFQSKTDEWGVSDER